MKLIYSIIFSILATAVIAQTELPTGQIEVIKDFEVRLMETNKIRIIPLPIEWDTTMRRYEYKLLAPSPSIDYEVPELKPLSINAETKPTYYPLFAKAGYGSPNSFLGEFSYDRRQTELLQWGVDFRHLSANNKKIPLQKFSDSRGRINGSYNLTEDLQLDGYIDGHFETVYFYGAENIPSNPDALKRSFNRSDAHFTLSNLGREGKGLKYQALFQYLFDKDDRGSRERALRVGGELETTFSKKAFPLGIKVLADLSTLEHEYEQSLNNILLEPYILWHKGGFKIHLGGIALFSKTNDETKTDENDFLPAIEVTYNLNNNRFILKGGWQGEVAKNNFHNLSSYNPYINDRVDRLENTINREIFAGVNGTSGSLQFELTGVYNQFKQMAFYLQDEFDTEQFNPVYDDGSYVGFEGSIKFEILKHVFLRSQIWQRFYSLDNEEKPWHMPSFGGDGQITYSGGDDIYHVSFIVHGENGLPYRTVGGTVDNLDPLIDLNLHGDYYFTPSIGAFAEVNNILGNNRERWYTYPSFGFNAKAGVLFRM